MVANVYSNGKHQRLRIESADLEELILRCGWTVLQDIDGLQDNQEALLECDRLYAQECVTDQGHGDEWWEARLLSSEPCLTPDI